MAFFKRIVDHLLNQLLVDSLANRCAVVPHGSKQERRYLRARLACTSHACACIARRLLRSCCAC